MNLTQSAARDIYVFMASSSDHVTGITGLGSALTVTMGKNGGALGSISPTVTERSNGWYTLSLTASHTDTQGELGFHVTGAGCDPSDFKHVVVAYNPFDAAYLGLTGIDELESRLTAARAGYLDELAAANIPTDLSNIYTRIGAPAGASIAADLLAIDNFVDDLETRLTAARAGYLDYLNTRLVGTIAAGTHNAQSGDAYARIGAPIGASISADIDNLPTATEIVNAIWAKVVDSTRTFGQFTKNVMAIMMGNKSETVDAGVTTETFYAENGVTIQLAGEIDSDKTRTIVDEG
jgi:hypothetical protein